MSYSQCRKPALKTLAFANQFDRKSTQTVFIHLKKWRQIKAEYRLGRKSSLLLLENSNPADYCWPIRNLDAIVLDFDLEPDELMYKKLSLVLLRNGCTGVIIIHKNSNGAYRYREANNASK